MHLTWAKVRSGFVALPECFTGKYGVQFFASYREPIPVAASDTSKTGSQMMAAKALQHRIFVTGGVIEEAEDGNLQLDARIRS